MYQPWSIDIVQIPKGENGKKGQIPDISAWSLHHPPLISLRGLSTIPPSYLCVVSPPSPPHISAWSLHHPHPFEALHWCNRLHVKHT